MTRGIGGTWANCSKKYEFEQDCDFRKPGGSNFNRRRLEQERGGNVTCRMGDGTMMKIHQISVDTSRWRRKEDRVPECERNECRGVVQSFMGLARQARPDIRGPPVCLGWKIIGGGGDTVAHCRGEGVAEGLRLPVEPAHLRAASS